MAATSRVKSEHNLNLREQREMNTNKYDKTKDDKTKGHTKGKRPKQAARDGKFKSTYMAGKEGALPMPLSALTVLFLFPTQIQLNPTGASQ